MPRRSPKPRAAAPTIETRVFRSGNSDAVRIPTRYNLRGTRVRVRALGDGRLLVEPIAKRRWPAGFLQSFGEAAAGLEPPVRGAPDDARTRRLGALFDDA